MIYRNRWSKKSNRIMLKVINQHPTILLLYYVLFVNTIFTVWNIITGTTLNLSKPNKYLLLLLLFNFLSYNLIFLWYQVKRFDSGSLKFDFVDRYREVQISNRVYSTSCCQRTIRSRPKYQSRSSRVFEDDSLLLLQNSFTFYQSFRLEWSHESFIMDHYH